MAFPKLQALWNHPAGPKTLHFWAPISKWGIVIANIADFSKPPEKISLPQQTAITATGVLMVRYIQGLWPRSYSNFSQYVFMAGTGMYQLTRKIRYRIFPKPDESEVKEQ